MYKAFGQTFIDDDHFLAFTGAFAALFNSSGILYLYCVSSAYIFVRYVCDKTQTTAYFLDLTIHGTDPMTLAIFFTLIFLIEKKEMTLPNRVIS